MFIKQIVIKGVEGDVEIMRTDDGALVTTGNRILCHMRSDDSSETRFEQAWDVAKVVCGTAKDGRTPLATNSMIFDVMREIERVADR